MEEAGVKVVERRASSGSAGSSPVTPTKTMSLSLSGHAMEAGLSSRVMHDSVSSTTPGVVKTVRQASSRTPPQHLKFFSSRLTAAEKKARACGGWCGGCECAWARKARRLYSAGFRYVVLFKWLKHLGPSGQALRQRLTIPILISFWMSIVIGIAWVYNGLLFGQEMQERGRDDLCLDQCARELGLACLEEYDVAEDWRETSAKFFMINSVYITVCALFSIHLVLEITGSLRNLGRALKDVLRNKDLSSIARKIMYSRENATQETKEVMQPIRSLVYTGVNLKKRAESAEAKWSEAARKVEMLEALIGMERAQLDNAASSRQQEEGEGDGDDGGGHRGDGGRRRDQAAGRRLDEDVLARHAIALNGGERHRKIDGRFLLQKRSDLTIFATTWNVGNACPPENLSSWLGGATLCDVVAVGVQECTYNVRSSSGKAGFNFQKTGEKILKSVAPTFGCASHFQKVVQQHLGSDFYLEEKVMISGSDNTLQDVAAIRLYIFVKKRHAPWVKCVSKHVVRRGYKMTLNKGAVAVSVIIYGVRCAFINSHFQAHQNKVGERNEDYSEISRKLFSKKHSVSGNHPFDVLTRDDLTPNEPVCCHHVVFWMGDLNYRIDLPHEEVCDYIVKCQDGSEEWTTLFEFDQLHKQRMLGNTFFGYEEKRIEFMPTYKLNEDRTGYDLKRTPAWCDRILHRSIPGVNMKQLTYDADCVISTSDHHPVAASYSLIHNVPILNASTTSSNPYSASINMWNIQFKFKADCPIGQALKKSHEKLTKSDSRSFSAERSVQKTGVVVLASENEADGEEDISEIADYLLLTCCGTMIECLSSSLANSCSLLLNLDMVQTLALTQFPEPIYVGLYLCNPKQLVTPRRFNTQMTSSFSQRNLTPPPSPRHGNTPSFTEEMKMEDLILEHYDCIGEGLINTMELFRKDKGDMLHFETTMLFSGLKVGMMSGDFSMEDKRDISRTWSGEG